MLPNYPCIGNETTQSPILVHCRYCYSFLFPLIFPLFFPFSPFSFQSSLFHIFFKLLTFSVLVLEEQELFVYLIPSLKNVKKVQREQRFNFNPYYQRCAHRFLFFSHANLIILSFSIFQFSIF